MKPRKVVIVSRIFLPEPAAASFRLAALARGFAAEGAQVTVLTTRPPKGMDPASVSEPYDIVRVPVLRDSEDYVRGVAQYLSFDVQAFVRLLVMDADIVVSEPPPTTGLAVWLSSALRRRPYIWYNPDVWTSATLNMDVPGVVTQLMRAAETVAARGAGGVITVSESMGEELHRVTGTPWDRMFVAENGIDTDTFTPEGPVADVPAPYFVYAGSISEWQGMDVFVEGLARILPRHPDATLHVLGRGSDLYRVQEVAARVAPDNVVFHGVQSPARTASFLRGAVAALASVVPHTGYDFAKPTKLYAAAACGAPSIYAGVGAGVTLVSENHLGTPVEFTPDAVARAMELALADARDGAREEQRARRAAWARDHASLAASGRAAAAWVLSGFHRASQ
ncbi:glycosyltransferase family 4 protein [Kocuria rhizophila]|uniref:Putative glycosyltransferase n=1 Tax=Kocuria rhizophila (strain ATCC 9341 / DSM 348 / NBRC 103217 / DC2201) TaxID=378753 RepID=B2GLF0_KOCRD|nr:glycosyltransferase family 4 protein [Kocuria rhizophila]BAG29243.1 putative glycosyltransferase [Kocuria rhizophila DC2201]VEH75476.1 putative glycosyl transferase [Kocuria rhizophila]